MRGYGHWIGTQGEVSEIFSNKYRDLEPISSTTVCRILQNIDKHGFISKKNTCFKI